MSLFHIEYKNKKIPYNLSSQILDNKILMGSSQNINNKSGTVNDLNFAHKQNLLNEFSNFSESNNSEDLLKNKKTFTSLLNIFNVPGGIKSNIDSLYSLAENSHLDDTLDELLNGMHKATKAVKNIFKGLF